MERRGIRRLRVAGGVGFLAVAVVTALSVAMELQAVLASLTFCDPRLLVLCADPDLRLPPSPDWTPVVALAAVGVVLLWPRRAAARFVERADR